MIIQLSRDLGAYLHEVFVAKFDFWLAFGIGAQILFALRFVVQWIASEKAGRSVMPPAFWLFSITGGMMILAYGIVRREPIIIMGQVLAVFIYVRNVMLIVRERRRRKSGAAPAGEAGGEGGRAVRPSPEASRSPPPDRS